jgi:AcrR family transcriptional regulator
MRNLQDATEMHPGSIYSAFGSKEGLFKEVISNYKQSGITALQACQANSDSPISALKLFMHQGIVENQRYAPSSICMLTKTLAELTSDHAELLDQTKKALLEMECEFEKLIREAQALGEVDPSKDPACLARHIQIQISGLRSYGKTHDCYASLDTLIEEVFSHHPF